MLKNKEKEIIVLDFEEIEKILKSEFKYLPNEPLSVCDPYYSEPITHYVDEMDAHWEEEYDKYNAVYEEEIKADPLRYPLILEMLEKKKEMAENPIIFDKEEEYYETDPHKLVNFDEYFTPFFEKEYNDVFFRNLKDPLRIKWEEIPPEDRKINIVPLDEAVKRLKYDEIQKYFDEVLISKDIVILFIKHMPNFWPIRKFYKYIQRYVHSLAPADIYKFFVEKVLILSSSYVSHDNHPLTREGKMGLTFLSCTAVVKKKLFKELTDCLICDKFEHVQESEKNILSFDILADFIEKYDLFEEPKYEGVSRIYQFREIAKIVLLLNLSFFNIFPIVNNTEFENLRKLNKKVFLSFLWYLKDLYWGDYLSPLKLKKDIKSYFTDEAEYENLNNLLQCYPSRMVAAKEYFFIYHNVILREEVQRQLDIYDKEKERIEREEYRWNADFYNLNKELQTFDKTKLKIYAKFRKEKRSESEIKAAIEVAYRRHLKAQKRLNKILFNKRSLRKAKLEAVDEIEIEEARRSSITFYVNEEKDEASKSYETLIEEMLELLIHSLKSLDLYDNIARAYNIDDPIEYPEHNIYKKIYELKYIEPNLWNKFKDYSYIAIDRYPDKIFYLADLYTYQKEFVIEFMRDIMAVWGTKGKYKLKRVLYKPSKRRRKRLLKPN